jgi:hypothetical protein
MEQALDAGSKLVQNRHDLKRISQNARQGLAPLRPLYKVSYAALLLLIFLFSFRSNFPI